MGRPDRCSARRGDSAQRRRVSAGRPAGGRARPLAALALCARVAACDVLVTATKMRKKPRTTAHSARRSGLAPTRSAARRAGRRRSIWTSRGSAGAPDGAPGDLHRAPARRRRRARAGASGARRRPAGRRSARRSARGARARSARSAACAARRRARGHGRGRGSAIGSPAWRSATARAAARASRRRPRRASFSRLRSSGSRRYCTSSHHARCRAGACRCSRPLSGAYGVS